MVPKTTHKNNDTTILGKLYMVLELSNAEWKLGFTVGLGQPPRLRSMKARDLHGLVQAINLATKRFGLSDNVRVLSCYEAGRDGFWLDRYLATKEVNNVVVDSASIEVNRRFRRAKTDRMDVGKLLNMLIRYDQGEQKVWSVVNVSSVEVEDQRELHRELMALKRERTHHINRIKGLLASQGVVLPFRADFLSQIEAVRLWDSSRLSSALHARVLREHERYQLVKDQIRPQEASRRECIRNAEGPAIQQVRQLLRLKGIGVNSAWLYVMEFFSWRKFQNRREVGALAG